MNQKFKTSLPAVGLLGLALLALGYIVSQFMVLEFEIILGILCFPFVLNFQLIRHGRLWQNQKEQGNIKGESKTYWRYFIWGAVFLMLYSLLGITSLAYFSAGLAVFFVLESTIGKVNHSAWIYLGITSPFFDFISKLVSFPIRLWITNKATSLLHAFDSSITSVGNIIYKGYGIEFSVDPECMGLNMIALCISLALVINSYFEKMKNYRLNLFSTVIFVLLAVTLSVVSNFWRIILLVIFESMPGTFSHEVIGLACLLVYAVVPYYLLTRWYFSKKEADLQHTINFNPIGKRNMVLGIALPLLLIFITLFAPPSSHVKKDKVFEQIKLNGYSKEIVEYNILKLEDKQSLIYIKPSVNFYGAHHSPLICWTGSGYKVNNEKQVTMGKYSYSTGILTLKGDSLYTAWWFDNGTEKTNSQWEWRLDMLKGANPYRLINVSCTTKHELKETVQKLLPENLFNTD
jgi:exosortase N